MFLFDRNDFDPARLCREGQKMTDQTVKVVASSLKAMSGTCVLACGVALRFGDVHGAGLFAVIAGAGLFVSGMFGVAIDGR